MPHFDEFYANKLRGQLGLADADAVLDLRGASQAQAEASLRDMLERSRFAAAKTVVIRLAPPPELLRRLRELHVLYDRDAAGGEFLHLYTVVLGGRVFLELVQRIGGYRGYGEINAPVRMAAHRRLGRG